MCDATFTYCIRELKHKAAHFEKTGLIPTLDSARNTIIKSDSLIDEKLQDELKAASTKFRDDQASNINRQPDSYNVVHDLINPAMYPLIYGISRFIQDEVVGVTDAVQMWAGKGTAIPEVTYCPVLKTPSQYQNYQWLPANVSFQTDGSVKFSSYVNNLHPVKYADIYHTIEKVIDAAVPAWDHCLAEHLNWRRTGPGRQKSRFSPPSNVHDEIKALWEPFSAEVMEQNDFKPITALECYREGYGCPNQYKWTKIRDPVLPEPDDTSDIDYSCRQSLHQKFRESGLQIIVKLTSIELTPAQPDSPEESWHFQNHMNERICATALYYLDSENVSQGELSLRTQTSIVQEELQSAKEFAEDWLNRVYGTSLGENESCVQSHGSIKTRKGRLLAFPNNFQLRVSSFSLKDRTKLGYRRIITLLLVDPHQRIVSTANVPPHQLDWWAEAIFGNMERAARGNMHLELFLLVLEQEGLAAKFPGDAQRIFSGGKLPLEIVDMVRKEGVVSDGLIPVYEAKHWAHDMENTRNELRDEMEEIWASLEYV